MCVKMKRGVCLCVCMCVFVLLSLGVVGERGRSGGRTGRGVQVCGCDLCVSCVCLVPLGFGETFVSCALIIFELLFFFDWVGSIVYALMYSIIVFSHVYARSIDRNTSNTPRLHTAVPPERRQSFCCSKGHFLAPHLSRTQDIPPRPTFPPTLTQPTDPVRSLLWRINRAPFFG